MLTGQARADFEMWYLVEIRKRKDIQDRFWDEDLLNMVYDSGDILRNAYMVTWFDSVGIPIEINVGYYDGYFFEYSIILSNTIKGEDPYTTRPEATTAAIIKANEIYNKQRAIESEQKTSAEKRRNKN